MLLESNIAGITQVIQVAIAPVFLLTAIGTIIAALNVRLSRAVDRRRVLEEKLVSLAVEQAGAVHEELALIARRINLVYSGMVLAVFCALLVCLLIAGAFIGFFLTIDLSKVVALLFILAMLALIVSLSMFLREVFLAVMVRRPPLVKKLGKK